MSDLFYFLAAAVVICAIAVAVRQVSLLIHRHEQKHLLERIQRVSDKVGVTPQYFYPGKNNSLILDRGQGKLLFWGDETEILSIDDYDRAEIDKNKEKYGPICTVNLYFKRVLQPRRVIHGIRANLAEEMIEVLRQTKRDHEPSRL